MEIIENSRADFQLRTIIIVNNFDNCNFENDALFLTARHYFIKKIIMYVVFLLKVSIFVSFETLTTDIACDTQLETSKKRSTNQITVHHYGPLKESARAYFNFFPKSSQRKYVVGIFQIPQM